MASTSATRLAPLRVGDLADDRQQLLERRAEVAAEAVGPVAADGHEAVAEVAGRRRQRRHLVAGQAAASHVDEHDRLVAGQPVERRQRLARRPRRRRGRRRAAPRPASAPVARRCPRRGAPAAAPSTCDGGVADVVLGDGVARRRRPAPGSGRGRCARRPAGSRTCGAAGGHVDDALVDDGAVAQQRQLHGPGTVGVDGDGDVERLALADTRPGRRRRRRRGRPRPPADDVVLDDDARARASRVASAAASPLGGPSVGHDDDPPAGVGRAARRRPGAGRRPGWCGWRRSWAAGWSSRGSGWTVSSSRASPPKHATPATAPSGMSPSASRTQSTASARPARAERGGPVEEEHGRHPVGRAERRDGASRAATSKAAMPIRSAAAARHWPRPTPRRRRANQPLGDERRRAAATTTQCAQDCLGRSARLVPGPGCRAGGEQARRPARCSDSAGSALTATTRSGRARRLAMVQKPGRVGDRRRARRARPRSSVPPGAVTVPPATGSTGSVSPTTRSVGGRAAPASSVRSRSTRTGKATCDRQVRVGERRSRGTANGTPPTRTPHEQRDVVGGDERRSAVAGVERAGRRRWRPRRGRGPRRGGRRGRRS